MYKISLDTIKKIMEVSNTLNNLEVKGFQNIGMLYNALALMQGIITEIDQANQDGIVIDKSKEA